MRVPWDRFYLAYEEYLRWEALALWVRAVVATEGSAPSWLAATLKKRCPGFIENEALLNEPRLLGFLFHEWIHNQIFGLVKQEGWLDALMFYGVRDIRGQSTWAYWEHCEREWHRNRPSSYPDFEEWLRLAQNYNHAKKQVSPMSLMPLSSIWSGRHSPVGSNRCRVPELNFLNAWPRNWNVGVQDF